MRRKLFNICAYALVGGALLLPCHMPVVHAAEESEETITKLTVKLKDDKKTEYYAANGVLKADDTLDMDDVEFWGTFGTSTEKKLSTESKEYTLTTNLEDVRLIIKDNQEITATYTVLDKDGKEIVKPIESTDNPKVSVKTPKAVDGVLTVCPQNFDTTKYPPTEMANDLWSDKEAIQKALDLASDSITLQVVFPKGTYYIGGPLYIHSNTTLKLADEAVIRRNSPSDEGLSATKSDREGVEHNMFKVSPYKTGSKGTSTTGGYSNGTNITIEGGTFDGGLVSNSKTTSNVLNFGHVSNLTIKNTTVKNCYGVHLIELAGVKDAEITGCTFTGFRAVTASDPDGSLGEAIQLDVCHKEGDSAWNSAYKADDTACANINIHDNTFVDYPVAVGNHHALDNHHHTGITISNNKITGSTMQYNGIHLYGCDNSIVNSNTITNYQTGIKANASNDYTINNNNISTATYGIISTDACTKGQLLANIIDGTTNQGIIVYGSKTSVSTISSNAITNTSGNGIIIHSSASADTVTGNRISNCGSCGIKVYSSATAPSITKNTISSCKSSGIQVYSSANAKTIKSNTISDCSKYGVYIYGKASVKTLSKNTITNTKKNGIYIKNDKIKITMKSNKLTSVGKTAIKINSKLSKKKKQTYTFAPKVVSLNLTGGTMTTSASNLKKIQLKVGKKTYKKSTKASNYTFRFKKYTKSVDSATATFTDKYKNTVARVVSVE